MYRSTHNLQTTSKVNKSGSLALDTALGTRGFTSARMVEISGDTGVGKTTLALHAIASCQQAGNEAAYIDAEYALDLCYAQKVGVNIDTLLVAQADSAEKCFEIAETLIESLAVKLIVIDSIAALLPVAFRKLGLDSPDFSMLEQSKVLLNGFLRLRSALKKSDCTVIFTNQLRAVNMKSGGYEMRSFGGKPVNNLMATRVRLKKGGDIKQQGNVIGHHCEMSVIKHKDGNSGGCCSTPMLYNSGMSLSYETLCSSIKHGVVKRKRTGYYFGENRLGLNGSQAKMLLDENPRMRTMINDMLLSIH